uniref:Uncharacterized protein n=1 Tax=Glossina pallidipes TaxID=7398 RepID=A0A1B0A7S2_GLOPL
MAGINTSSNRIKLISRRVMVLSNEGKLNNFAMIHSRVESAAFAAAVAVKVVMTITSMVRKTHPTSAVVAERWTVIIITIMVAEIAATISKSYIRALLLVKLIQVVVSNGIVFVVIVVAMEARGIVVIEETKTTINYSSRMQICGKD